MNKLLLVVICAEVALCAGKKKKKLLYMNKMDLKASAVTVRNIKALTSASIHFRLNGV